MTPNNPVAAAILNDLAHGDAFVRMTYQSAAHLLPVALREDIRLDDLLGIDRQKTALLANIGTAKAEAVKKKRRKPRLSIAG